MALSGFGHQYADQPALYVCNLTTAISLQSKFASEVRTLHKGHAMLTRVCECLFPGGFASDFEKFQERAKGAYAETFIWSVTVKSFVTLLVVFGALLIGVIPVMLNMSQASDNKIIGMVFSVALAYFSVTFTMTVIVALLGLKIVADTIFVGKALKFKEMLLGMATWSGGFGVLSFIVGLLIRITSLGWDNSAIHF